MLRRGLLWGMVLAAMPALLCSARRGDVTGDDVVDGRDALRIIQILEERVDVPPPEDAFWVDADVHPLPAEPGGAQGDGEVTREDALTILRLAMGLISGGEFDGVYAEPVIHGWDPLHGMPGTRITFSGENFVAGVPAENLVAFGGVEAVVESSTADELTVIVPEGAVTAPVTVATPGGWTESDSDFIVTAPLPAEFRPSAGEAREFTFMTRFGEAAPGRDGQLVFEVDPSSWTLLTALPADGSEAVYMCLSLPDGQGTRQRTGAEVVDGPSTARALVFLSPFFLNWDANEAAALWDLITTDESVTAFGAVVENVMPTTGEPFEDAGFAAAYRDALESVSARIPAADKPRPAEGDGGDAGAARDGQSSVYSRDFRTLTIEQEFDPDANGGAGAMVVNVDTIQTNPVDWRVVVAELHPESLFDMFPRGAESLTEADPLVSYERSYEFESFKAVEMRLGKAITRRFAILTTLMGDLVDAVGMTGSGVGPALSLPDREGVYIVRCFAPIIDSTVDGDELRFLDESPSDQPGAMDFRRALIANIAMLIVDGLDAAVGLYNIGSPNSGREVVRATTATVGRSLVREFPDGFFAYMTHSERFSRLWLVFQDGVDAAVKQAVTEAAGVGKGKLAGLIQQAGGSLASGVKTGGGVLVALDVVSYVGPIGERLAAMAGYGLIERFGLRLSPMETAFVMVGEPFDWEVDSTEPSSAGPGDEVTLIGRKFDHRDKDHNEVYLQKIPENGGIRAEIVSVSEDGTRLTFIVPEFEGYGYTDIYLRTPFAQDRAGSIDIVRKPLLRSISPGAGFAAREGIERDAFAAFRGTEVELARVNMYSSDTLFFGDVEALGDSSEWRVPFLNDHWGPVDVRLRTADGVESNTLQFLVLQGPWLSNANPSVARLGELITVRGDRFGTKTYEIRVTLAGVPVTLELLENDRFIFKMPNVGEPGDELPLVVETPGGADSSLTITREAGITVPDRPDLPGGYTIVVNETVAGINADGKVSLDDAAAFARGDENPFAPPWEDRNIDVTEDWTQNERLNNDTELWEYYWLKTSTQTETRPGGPGYEYRRTYRVDHYHPDKGGGVSEPYLTASENLDATAEDREEGDYVQGAVGGADHRDETYFNTQQITYNCLALRLGPNDYLSGTVTVKTHISPIVLRHKSRFQVDAVEAGEMQGGAESAVLHVTGDSNTVSATFRDAPGTAVFVESGIDNDLSVGVDGCGAHGILLLNAHRNNVREGGEIRNCGGDGIRIENGQENEVSRSRETTTACAGAGVRIIGGCANDVYLGTVSGCGAGCIVSNSLENLLDGRIENCSGHGLTIAGGGSHTLRLVVEGCQGHGILLDGSSGNTFSTEGSGLRAENNQGSGLHLTNGSSLNFISGTYNGNAAGIVIEGADTAHNTLRNSCVQAGAENAGNRGPGLHIRAGAHHNTGGVLCIFQHNAGDGILIEGDGTRENTLAGLSSEFNQGAGLTIRGAGAVDNHIRARLIGCAGAGVVIDGALGTTLTETWIEDCQGGGLLIDGVTKDWAEGEEPYALVTVRDLEVRNPQSPPAGGTRGEPVCGVTIRGGTTNALIEDLTCSHGDIGVFIDHEATAGNRLTDVTISDPALIGIQIDDAVETTLSQVSIFRSGSHGILLQRAHGTQAGGRSRIDSPGGDGLRLLDTWAATFTDEMWVQHTGGNGVFAEGCTSLFLEASTVLNVSQNGVELQSCTDVHLEAKCQEGAGHGILVGSQCADIRMEAVKCFDNAGVGVHIDDAGGVAIADILQVTGNQIGIRVTDGRDISIANSARERYNPGVSENLSAGILVEGANSESVSIRDCFVAGNLEAGIQVQGGKGIVIGGAGATDGNFVADNPVGILVEGSDTDVSIRNNIVGPIAPDDRDAQAPSSSGASDRDPQARSSGGETSPGNAVGIQFEGGVGGATMRDNRVRNNTQTGVLVHDGATGIVATGNRIEDNEGPGVHIQSAACTGNMFGGNRITGNQGQGIVLEEGANNGIAAPVVRQISQHTVSGTVEGVPEGTFVEIYTDPDDEGERLIGTARVRGNSFSISGKVPEGRQINAIAIDPDGNTSEFGPAQLAGDSARTTTYVFTSTRTGDTDVFLQTLEALSKLTDAPSADTQPRLAPDGQDVVFVSDRGGGRQLFRVAAGGGGAVPLTFGDDPAHSPDWHPGGSGLAFACECDDARGTNTEIFSLTWDTPEPTGEIAYEDGVPDDSLGFSPGRMAAVRFSSAPGVLGAIRFYITANPGTFTWRVYDWDPATETFGDEPLREGETTPTGTGWHTVRPEGLETDGEFAVAILWTVQEQPEIGAAEGSAECSWRYVNDQWYTNWSDFLIRAVVPPPVTRLTDSDAVDQHPAWSPDGARIAFASDRGGSMAVWTMAADGSNPQPVEGLPGNQTQPRWSPDGTRLVFISDAGGNPDVWVADADGTGAVNLTQSPEPERDPCWTRENLILFASEREAGWEVYRVRPDDGTGVRRLTTSFGANTEPHAP